MKMFIPAVLAFLITYISAVRAANLTLSVYYEVLCPDSRRFITQQLYPVYDDFRPYIDVNLIPFGKASSTNKNGRWTFQCQHGPKECYGNQYHACVIHQYPIQQSLNFVYCSMAAYRPSSDEVLEKCSVSNGISWDSLRNCYYSGEGANLLAQNGVFTKPAIGQTNFVPTILFNGQYDPTLQSGALSNLRSVLCSLLDICQ